MSEEKNPFFFDPCTNEILNIVAKRGWIDGPSDYQIINNAQELLFNWCTRLINEFGLEDEDRILFLTICQKLPPMQYTCFVSFWYKQQPIPEEYLADVSPEFIYEIRRIEQKRFGDLSSSKNSKSFLKRRFDNFISTDLNTIVQNVIKIQNDNRREGYGEHNYIDKNLLFSILKEYYPQGFDTYRDYLIKTFEELDDNQFAVVFHSWFWGKPIPGTLESIFSDKQIVLKQLQEFEKYLNIKESAPRKILRSIQRGISKFSKSSKVRRRRHSRKQRRCSKKQRRRSHKRKMK